MRYLVVVDGEHHPPVVRAALDEIAERGDEVAAAMLAGGKEKLGAAPPADISGVALISGSDPVVLLDRALTEHRVDAVLDLSDEPVLDYRRRHELAAVALHRGVAYEGADFRFTPPARPRIAATPSVAVVATGKRTGKTAVTGLAARTLKASGRAPVIVAMGRGGPARPEVLRGDEVELNTRDLLELADAGGHAASDYVEDALLARVATVGCRRCGGGLAGGVEFSNVAEGVRLADELSGDLLLLEGSGSAIPPLHADATVLVCPSFLPEEHLAGYMGPYRVLLADLVVVTMCEDPFGSPSRIPSLASRISDAFAEVRRSHGRGHEPEVVRTIFRPSPVTSVDGASVLVATTAPLSARGSITRHLEAEHGCRVAGVTHSLSDRAALETELQNLQEEVDVLLCEIKAAAIDVAARWANDRGIEVVFMDNLPRGVDGDDVASALLRVSELAARRFEEHGRDPA